MWAHSHLYGSTPFLQVLAKLASNNARQQLAFRLCLNNISQCVASPIMAAKIALQLYPMAVSRAPILASRNLASFHHSHSACSQIGACDVLKLLGCSARPPHQQASTADNVSPQPQPPPPRQRPSPLMTSLLKTELFS